MSSFNVMVTQYKHHTCDVITDLSVDSTCFIRMGSDTQVIDLLERSKMRESMDTT